jgi:hypothetical protein
MNKLIYFSRKIKKRIFFDLFKIFFFIKNVKSHLCHKIFFSSPSLEKKSCVNKKKELRVLSTGIRGRKIRNSFYKYSYQIVRR